MSPYQPPLLCGDPVDPAMAATYYHTALPTSISEAGLAQLHAQIILYFSLCQWLQPDHSVRGSPVQLFLIQSSPPLLRCPLQMMRWSKCLETSHFLVRLLPHKNQMTFNNQSKVVLMILSVSSTNN